MHLHFSASCTIVLQFCKLRGRPGKANSSLAAFIAGSTILMEDPGRRGTISMYLLVR